MRSRFLVTAATAILIAASACALDFTPPSTKLDKTPAGTYTLDTSHANIIFNLNHLGFSRYFGRFNALDGKLVFDPKNPENSKISVTVDMNSIDTNNATLEGELKSSQWFDSVKYPTATFVSTNVQKLSDSTGKVSGDLTIRGITKPVVLDVTFNGAGIKPMVNLDTLGFSAQTQIKRSDFGVNNGIPMVGDAVTLTIEAEFHHAKQQ